jgi:outer membrane protein insertion porin family
LEATYPLIKDANIKGVLFFDSGNVWADDENVDLGDLRYGAGFGFRWAAPIGLLRLEWGFNLDPKPEEEQPGWEFSIGTMF